jgi:hypothetical protein
VKEKKESGRKRKSGKVAEEYSKSFSCHPGIIPQFLFLHVEEGPFLTAKRGTAPSNGSGKGFGDRKAWNRTPQGALLTTCPLGATHSQKYVARFLSFQGRARSYSLARSQICALHGVQK